MFLSDAADVLLNTPSGTLTSGSQGGSVSNLQTVLNQLGANLTVDGIYGPLTQAAVMTYQQWAGRTMTGEADESTLVSAANSAKAGVVIPALQAVSNSASPSVVVTLDQGAVPSTSTVLPEPPRNMLPLIFGAGAIGLFVLVGHDGRGSRRRGKAGVRRGRRSYRRRAPARRSRRGRRR